MFVTTTAGDAQAGDYKVDDVLAHGRVVGLHESIVSLKPSGTEYVLDLVVTDQTKALLPEAGKRTKGRINARALRLHPATAGGCFIEPLEGAPRIIAGRIRHIEHQARRLLVEAVVPFWIQFHDSDDPAQWEAGQMINCYVESGTTFEVDSTS